MSDDSLGVSQSKDEINDKNQSQSLEQIKEAFEEKQFKVLIANDEMIQLEVLAFKFEKSKKCCVEKAVNGFEAYEMVMKKFNAEQQ